MKNFGGDFVTIMFDTSQKVILHQEYGIVFKHEGMAMNVVTATVDHIYRLSFFWSERRRPIVEYFLRFIPTFSFIKNTSQRIQSGPGTGPQGRHGGVL